MTYSVQVIGRLWQGSIGAYEYQSERKPVNQLEVKYIAGDFAEVIDYQVTKTQTSLRYMGDKTIETKSTRVVSHWGNPISASQYTDLCEAA